MAVLKFDAFAHSMQAEAPAFLEKPAVNALSVVRLGVAGHAVLSFNSERRPNQQTKVTRTPLAELLPCRRTCWHSPNP